VNYFQGLNRFFWFSETGLQANPEVFIEKYEPHGISAAKYGLF